MKKCAKCNKPLSSRQTKYCSLRCQRSKRGTGKEFPCLNCGKIIYRQKSIIARNKSGEWFCSGNCKNTYKRSNSIVTCPICGTPIYVKPHRHKRGKHPVTCSHECKLALLQWGKTLVYCDYCGEEIHRKNSEVQKREHHFCNRSCMGKWQSKNKTGQNSNSWKGGYQPYYGKDWVGNRRQAKQRDNNTCQSCGAHENSLDHTAEVHHIKPVRLFDNPNDANQLDNLITLCRVCHIKFDVFARWFFDQSRRQTEITHPLQNYGTIARVYFDSKT
ncbi:MAG: hypothetical protein GTO60_16785 [Gammaproteobacteria bacterium]|nr:hypothetical protein [Gammaproteobacteria bacterium]